MQGRVLAIFFTPLLVGFAAWLGTPGMQAADPQDFAVKVTAQVQESPPRIQLQWPAGAFSTSYAISRKLRDDQSWSPLASVPGDATGFADDAVVLGAAYEYEIMQQNSDGLIAYGYIYAAIQLSCPGDRGRLVLMVDTSVAPDLQVELSLLQSDLLGDGWTVLRHDIDRASTPPDVKALIQQDYGGDPANTKAVFLFGHVPVPYSGDINPDQHPTHKGAWPADVFYADMSGTWTDASVDDTSSEDPRNHNIPGDGKYDQSDTPGTAVLQVGRVDFSDLPTFSESEVELLRRYLNKNHSFRHGSFQVAQRGLIRDNFGEIDGDAPATDAWRTFIAFFGPAGAVPVGPDEFFPTLDAQSFLWAYGGGGGEYYQADTVGSTSDFAIQSPQCVFYMLDGSYFGDWDSPDNLLRAALASPGYGLAAAWTGLPHWFLHHMALGETIGFSTLLAQNNRGLYENQVNSSAGQVHIGLMGDPTLRMQVTEPPANLQASSTNGSVELSWTPPSESVVGYYVYRADALSGPFSRLVRNFITDTSFTDDGAPPGSKTYMVRAIKLETSASGSYYNPSQGVFVTVDAGSGPVLPVVNIDAITPNANEVGPVDGSIVITRAGPTNAPLTVSFDIGGTAVNGTDYAQIANSVVIPAGATSGWITIHPISDYLVDTNETVTLTLSSSAAYVVGPGHSASITIQEAPPPNPPPTMLITRQTGRLIALRFQGTAGAAFSLKFSGDLLKWTLLGTGVVGNDSWANFMDTVETNRSRFYRAEWQ
jgi:hypothetical protein